MSPTELPVLSLEYKFGLANPTDQWIGRSTKAHHEGSDSVCDLCCDLFAWPVLFWGLSEEPIPEVLQSAHEATLR